VDVEVVAAVELEAVDIFIAVINMMNDNDSY